MIGERKSLKILIADDTTTTRQMVREMLRTLPYDITCLEAGDGVDAVRIFSGEHPDISLLDLEMPRKSGLVAATEIRKLDGRAHVIVMSGRLNDKVTDYLKGININHLLPKPVSADELRRIISALVPVPGKKVNILIADDSKTMCGMLSSLCQLPPLEIALTTAEDGEKALIEFRSKPHHMVFLDVNMPKIDGLTVLKTMKRLNSSCVVTMITSDRTEKTIRAAIGAGANGYIAKPFTLEQVQGALKKALSAVLVGVLHRPICRVGRVARCERLISRRRWRDWAI